MPLIHRSPDEHHACILQCHPAANFIFSQHRADIHILPFFPRIFAPYMCLFLDLSRNGRLPRHFSTVHIKSSEMDVV
jgi:hypothetical protein